MLQGPEASLFQRRKVSNYQQSGAKDGKCSYQLQKDSQSNLFIQIALPIFPDYLFIWRNCDLF